MTPTLGVFFSALNWDIDSLHSLFSIKICDRRHYCPLLLFSKFWIDRQREDFQAGGFRHRKISRLVPQIREGPLKVQRLRIVDFCWNPPALQMLTQCISLTNANRELVVHMSETRRCNGTTHHGG